MKRKLIIDGNAVYELDEDCMLTKKLDEEEEESKHRKKEQEQRE